MAVKCITALAHNPSLLKRSAMEQEYKEVLQFAFSLACLFIKDSAFLFVKKCYMCVKHQSYNYYNYIHSFWYPVNKLYNSSFYLEMRQIMVLSNI